MEYLMQMRLADSGRSTSPAAGAVFIEQYILPTLARCERLQREGRIVAGGPVSGAVALSFVIRADSAPEIDALLGGLPVWPLMVTTVTPLTTWQQRGAALRPSLERLRAGQTRTEALASSATSASP